MSYRRRFLRLVVIASITFAIHIATVSGVQAAGPVDFNRDVRPILSENCFFCHGPDEGQRQADLRLDLRDAAVEAGAFTPGDADASELIARIETADPDSIMPPPDSKKVLSADQRRILREWIQAGAKYDTHWSFTRIERPEVPQVRRTEWIRNPIDAFILAKLEAEDVQPSPAADAHRVLRRVHLDVTGLPPKWTEVETLAAEGLADGEYDAVVEELLESPHYGERMAIGWLDVARYADTVGYHGDQNQHVFPYRDWVIAAYNENKPFDQFTIEQLAGDLLPNPSPDQLIATGFNRVNMVTREGGAQPGEYLAKYQADRVRTLGMAWLGMTTGCGECHDHKYDPFKTRDFYQLSAFFADIKQWGVYQDYDYTPNPDLRGWSNDHPFPPEIEVRSDFLLREQRRLRDRLEALARESILAAPEATTAYQAWAAKVRRWYDEHPSGWSIPGSSEWSTGGEVARKLDDGSWLLLDPPSGEAHDQSPKDRSISIGCEDVPVVSVRLELLPAEEHGGRLLRGDRDAISMSLDFELRKDRQKVRDVPVRRADAEAQTFDYANTFAVLDVGGRWRLPPGPLTSPLAAVWQFREPVSLAEGETLVAIIRGDGLGRIRLSVAPDARLRPLDDSSIEATYADLDREIPSGLAAISHALAGSSDNALRSQAAELEKQYRECRDGMAWTQIVESVEPFTTRILPRGNWQDESGPIVEPNVPAFLPQPQRDAEGRRLTRLDLARWLVSRENPLTARVIVNRLWAQFFGTGLSATLDDFGAQGEAPSHPELLDWLASEFIESGWDIKHIVRLIVTSNTYRQDSRVRSELHERDPNNRWLAFHPPRGLEAEIVRDNALAIAGLINLDMGGPAVFPYQPPGYYANLQFPDRDYIASTDHNQHRRGVYMHWQRTFLHPMLANFDAPSREDCVALRNKSNTPQQALTLLNDPTFTEAARVMAAGLLAAEPGDDRARLRAAFRQALLRDPEDAELKQLERFQQARLEEFRAAPDEALRLLEIGVSPAKCSADPDEWAAWTATCRVLLSLHETNTRY